MGGKNSDKQIIIPQLLCSWNPNCYYRVALDMNLQIPITTSRFIIIFMEKSSLFIVLFTCFLSFVSQAQGGFAQLGSQFVEDQGHRIISTSDGGYITAGTAGTKAVLYRTDCLGTLVAKIEKTVVPGPAAFWDVKELNDGSIVAVGSAAIASPTDTGTQVFLLKTTPLLVEVASSSFRVLGKEAVGKSIAQTPSGQLLIWGEVTGVSVDFTDAFFQRVSPVTLQPTADPVIVNQGVDLASRIINTADGNYLLTGSSFAGNIFNPDAPIDNTLRAYKVDENGSLLWQAGINQVFLAKYGVARACGAAQNPETGNFMLGGTLYGGTDSFKQDAFYALISNDGAVLDTSFASANGQQQMFSIVAHHDLPGLFTMVGESDGSPLGIPSIAFSQGYEIANTIAASGVSLDPDTPISLRDINELDPGRFAFMGTLPDNPITLGATDIVVVTPEVTVGIVYQNCALAATLSSPALGFQWLYEGEAIPGANQGVYFPTQKGLYQVQVLDAKGCLGVSEPFQVDGPTADFTFTSNGLDADFVNASVDATTFIWSFGDGATSTQTNPHYAYSNPGVYVVRLICVDPCGLRDTVEYELGVTPAREPSWLTGFSLSPNPTGGKFHLDLSGEPNEALELAILNATGQLLSREVVEFKSGVLHKDFALDPYPAGLYLLQIKSGKASKNVRVLKQ